MLLQQIAGLELAGVFSEIEIIDCLSGGLGPGPRGAEMVGEL